jgi:small-conductance mechanosensitive channel
VTIASRSLTVLLLVLSAVAPVRAQEATSAPAPTPPEPIAIQAAAIPQRSEESFARLRDIVREVDQRGPIDPMQRALPGVAAEVQSLERDPRTQPAAIVTLPDIEDVQQRWGWVREELNKWNAALTDLTIALDERLQELQRIEEAWAATEASAVDQGIPKILRDNVRATRADVARVTSELRTRRAAVLTLHGAIAELNARAAAGQVNLDVAAERVRSQLFISESEPIWTIARIIKWQNIRLTLATVWTQSRNDLAQFFRNQAQVMLFHVGIGIVLVLVALRVRERSQSWELDEAATEMLAQLRDRPISAAMLVTAFLSVYLYGQLPSAVRALFVTITFFPLVRVLRAGIFAKLPTAPIEVAALAVFVSLAGLFPPRDPVTRIVLIMVSAAIWVWLTWIGRPQRLLQIQTTIWWRRFVTAGVRIGQFVAVGAVVANVIGNVSLAVLLTYGAVGSVFSAVAIDATRQVATGLYVAVLSSRVGRSLNLVRTHADTLRQRGIALITFGAVATWITRTLIAFSAFDPVVRGTRTALQTDLQVGSLQISLGDVLALAITIWLSVMLSRIVAVVLEEDVLPRLSLPRGVPGAVSVTAKYAVLVVGFLAALSAAGVELGQLTVLLGAFGLGLSFGLQNIVNNFVSGLILIFERPIQVGDVIQVEQITGEVRSIGIRSSVIRTFDGAEVIVPNGNMLSQSVTNWTLSDRKRRVELTIGVAYGTDPKQVIELLLGVAREHPDVLDQPPPSAVFMGFGASSLDFSLRMWTLRQEPFPQLKSDVGVGMYKVLTEAGIEIPFPQTDLHVYSETATRMLALAKEAEEATHSAEVSTLVKRSSG